MDESVETLKSKLAEAEKTISSLKSSDDLSGIKNNRDEILAEKRILEEKFKKMKAEIEQKETASLTEQKKFKELYEKSEASIKSLQDQIFVRKKQDNLISSIKELGINFDLDYVDLIKGIQFDENGVPTNTKAVLEKLKSRKPKLFEEIQKVDTDTSKTKTKLPGEILFTREQIKAMSSEEYLKNKAKIKSQEARGLVQ